MTSPARPQRRPLSFANLGEVLADVERLRAGGYERAGNWDLAQTCGHLAAWMSYPMDGFPMRRLPWLIRITIGKLTRRRILKSGRMPARLWTVKESVPAPGGDESAAVERLRQTAERWGRHGEFLPSPLFGRMDREQWTRFQCIHCAHHLSFLVPRAG